MNQEQNNININTFNTEGDNGIPNNQPLNNQSFNNTVNPNVVPNSSDNQPTFNPQPMPSYEQPIMQEPTPQPMNNTFGSGNTNNQNFNSKPPKKINLGLIIGIVAAVAVVVVGIIFGSKLLSNGDNNKNDNLVNETNNSNSKINSSLEKLTKNDNVYLTNYVDTQLGYYFEYPITIDLNDYEHKSGGRESKVLISRDGNKDTISSIYGGHTIKIIRHSLAESNASSLSFEELINLIKSRYYANVSNAKLIKEYKNNNINWAKYSMEFGNGEKEYLYIAKYNDVVLVISFPKADKKLSSITDELYADINKNKESICDNIINSLKFSNDKQSLLNIKEASVLYYNTTYETESVLVYDANGNEHIFTAYMPDMSGVSGIAYEKTSDINIDNIINKVTTYPFQHRELAIDTYSYSIKNTSDVMIIKEKNVGEYKVKYYELEESSPSYSFTNTKLAYVFETDKYYGIIVNSGNPNYSNNRTLEYAIKHLSFKDDIYPYDVSDYAK